MDRGKEKKKERESKGGGGRGEKGGWMRGRRWCEGGAKRPLVAGEITFCNSTVRRRILIPAINLEQVRATRGPVRSWLSSILSAAAKEVPL